MVILDGLASACSLLRNVSQVRDVAHGPFFSIVPFDLYKITYAGTFISFFFRDI